MTVLPWAPLAGASKIAAINTDGYLYWTTNFNDPNGPEWNWVDLDLYDAPVQFVADPFSPAYTGGETSVNGWILTRTRIYRIEGIFATPQAELQKTLYGNTPYRNIDFSSSVPGYGVAIANHADGIRVTHTEDGGETWANEQVIGDANRDPSHMDEQGIPGLYVSSKTPGRAIIRAWFNGGGNNSQSKQWISEDNGATWDRYDQLDPEDQAEYPYLSHLAGDQNYQGIGALHIPWAGNDDECFVYYVVSKKQYNVPWTHHLLRAEPDGTQVTIEQNIWEENKLRVPFQGRWDISPSLQNKSRLAIAAYHEWASSPKHKLYISENAGENWSDCTLNFPSSAEAERFRRVVIAGDKADVLYMWGDDGRIWYSEDSGDTIDDRRGNITSSGEFVGIASDAVWSEPAHDGEASCPWCHAGNDNAHTTNPISLRKGEKRLEVTDLSLNTPAGPLAFTRKYRQSKQEDPDFQHLGLGWMHNYAIQLRIDEAAAQVVLDNGCILKLFKTTATQFQADAGSNSVMNLADNKWTLTAPDGSTYIFEDAGSGAWRAILRTWTNGETWTFNYYEAPHYAAGKLKDVEDGYGRKFQFTYVDNTGQYDHLSLWRVGDQDTTELEGSTPAGRYVEFAYTPEKSDGQPVTGAQALLASVRDTRGNIWTYDYYGQGAGESNANLLNFMVQRQSPSVDTNGDGQPDGATTLENLAYTVASGTITNITQQRGNGLLETTLTFNDPGSNNEQTTTEEVAGKTTRHYFEDGVYAGAEDALGHRTSQSPNGQFRPDHQEDANGNETLLGWSKDGKHLEQVTDALEQETQFTYDDDDRLQISTDAQGRDTHYVYDANSRQPTMILVGASANEIDINGGMELDSDWSDVGSPTIPSSRMTTRVDSGDHSRHVVANEGTGIESADWVLETTQHYVIRARVYPVSGTITMQVPGITPTTSDKSTTDGSDAWETLTITYTHTTSPASKRLQFLAAAGGSAEFYVDSVSVVTKGEIDVNGGMELADPNSGWLDVDNPNTPSARSAQKVDSGDYSRLVVADDSGQGIENDTPFALLDDQTYTIRARVYVVDNTGNETVKMHLVDNSDQELSGTTDTSKFRERWETLSCVYRPDGDQTSIRLQFLADGSPATFYVDTVSITLTETLSLHGDMEDSGYWSDIPNYEPQTNEQCLRVDSGTYFRYVQADDGQGITTSDTFTLEEDHTYIAMARVCLVTNKAVKMTVTGSTGFDVVASTDTQEIGRWQTLRAIHTVETNEAGSCLLQFLAQADGAQFYVDTIHVLDLGVINGSIEGQIRWQEFAYDTKGRPLAEQVIRPTDAQVAQETIRSYYVSGPGGGLPEQVVQTDLDGNDNVTSTFFYDSAGRAIRTRRNTTFGSCTSSYTVYDDTGNVLASICNYDPGTHAPPTSADEAAALYDASAPDKNQVTTYQYDEMGRRVEVTTNAGAEHAISTLTLYDALSRVIRTISHYKPPQGANPPGEWEWNAQAGQWEDGNQGSPVLISHGADNTENVIADTAYNQRGQVKLQRDVLGHVTLYGYDDAGRQVKVVRNAATPDYNNDYTGDPDLSAYQPVDAPDQDLITTSEYDPAGNLIRSVDPLDNASLMVYDVLNRLVKTVRSASDPDYDIQNDLTLTSYTFSDDPDLDLVEETVYETMGRVLYTQDVMGSRTWYAYDDLDRQIKTIANAQGTATDDGENDPRSDNYDASDDTDKDLISLTHYDGEGRVQWALDPIGRRTWYVYDGLGRQIRTVVNCTYDPDNPQGTPPDDPAYTGSTDSDKDLISRTFYDTDGRVARTIDARGNETRYAYDTLGRRTLVVRNFYDDGNIDTDLSNWEWNPNGPYWEDGSSRIIPRGDALDRNVIAWTGYDLAGRVSVTRDTAGRETRYEYDVLGRRRRTIVNYVDGTFDPDFPDEDLISQTEYDVAGQVTAIVDARGTTTAFEYDDAGRQVVVTQAAGTSLATQTYTCYDKAGRVLRVITTWVEPEGENPPSPDDRDETGVWTFAPTTHGHFADENLITEYELDHLGRRVVVTNPVGSQVASVYAKDGRLVSATDPLGKVSQHRYDELRRLVRVVQGYYDDETIDPEPSHWEWNPNGPYWEDGSSHVIPHGNDLDRNVITSVEYDKAGRLTVLTDPRHNETSYSYDQLNRRTALTDPLDHTWQTGYEDADGGSRVTLTDPETHVTRRKLDRLGRLKTIDYLSENPKVTPDVTFTYDPAGNRVTMVEDNGISNVRATEYTYDAARRLTQVDFDTDGNGSTNETVQYEYDAGGLRTRLTLPGDLSVTYTYDAKGRLVSLTDWDGGTTRFAHDRAERMVSAERSNGFRTSYAFDAGGRLRQLRHTQGGHTLGHFVYEVDERGNRVQALECLPHPATPNDVLYGYDDVSIAYHGTWTDDAPYRVSTQFSASLALLFFGRETSLTVGVGPDHGLFDVYLNGTLWRSFDGYAVSAGERDITISLASEGPHTLEIRNQTDKNLASTGYTLRFKQLLVPDVAYDLHTIEYTYDALSRLQAAHYNPGLRTGLAEVDLLRRYQYSYDLAGNRTQAIETVAGTPTTSNYTYNEANQIDNQGFDYDANGNLTDDGTNSYVWDRANRLLSMGGHSYDYDGLGNRVSQTVSSIVTRYLLDVQPGLVKVLAETASGNTIRYVHGLRGIHALEDSGGAWTWMIQDGLGSVRSVVDDVLAVDSIQSYAPYGEALEPGSFGSPFTFTAEQTDANGLVYLRARYYSPALGVFPNLDPMEGDAGQPMSLNRYMYVQGNVVNDAVGELGLMNGYSYVNGNPVNLTDPSGMIAETPGMWDRCFQNQNTRNCSCYDNTQANVPVPYADRAIYLTAYQVCQMGGFSAYPECSSPTPTPSNATIVLFGGSQGNGNLNLEGPAPECQTPVWYDIADQIVSYPGTLQPNPDNAFTGKRLQAFQAGNPQPNSLVIGYSAGADSALIYSFDHRNTGNIRGVVLLDGTLDGTRTDGRRLGCFFGDTRIGCTDGRDENVWREMFNELLANGIDVYFLDDSAGGGQSKVASYKQPSNASGRFKYDPRLSTEHLQGGLSGLRGTGTNNSEAICRDILTWFGEDPTKCFIAQEPDRGCPR